MEKHLPKAEKPGPLSGVTVIELCQALAGPYCCMMLSDMGARVIKVEKPGGDDSRGMPPHFINGTSVYFMSINRGKESVVIDIKTPEGRDLLLGLVAKADVVVENNRPGVLDRLGLGFEAMKAANPRIVVTSISGFGQDGPYRDLPAYDMIVQAMSGGMSVTGEPNGKPVRSGVPIGDMCAGMSGALAAVGALHQARATGEAQHADVAMLDVQVSMLSYQMAYHLASGVVPSLQGRSHSGTPLMGAYEASDGVEVLISPLAEHMWGWVCRALGADELEKDPRFVDRPARLANAGELRQTFEQIFRTRPADEWVDRMRAEGVPVAKINDFAGVIADEQVQHRGMVANTDYDGEPIRLIGSPLNFAGVEKTYAGPPSLGGNGRAILSADLGLNEAQITSLEQGGVVMLGRSA